MNILDVIANNGVLVLISFAVVSMIVYAIVGMTGPKGQIKFREGLFWVVVSLIIGLSAKNLAAWIVANFS